MSAPIDAITPALFSVKMACVYLSVSSTTLYQLIRAGIPSVNQGSKVYITKTALDAYIASLEESASAVADKSTSDRLKSLSATLEEVTSQ